VFAGAAAAALLGLAMPVIASTPSSPNPPEDCKRPRAEAIEKTAIPATPRMDAPSRGRADAKVTVEVWPDFECAFCARGAATLNALHEKYGEQVRIVFRQSPLPSHEHARLAAAASMAAHEQGKFWEFHDGLFARQEALDRASLEALAGKLNLDVERFRHALDSSTRNKQGHRHAFFINGKIIAGAQPMSTFESAIDAALTR
jgi:protein-disulfide isomerase